MGCEPGLFSALEAGLYPAVVLASWEWMDVDVGAGSMTSSRRSEPKAVIQETGSNGLTVYWDREKGITTIFVPSWDANDRPYLREITVAGNNVVSLGRDSA